MKMKVPLIEKIYNLTKKELLSGAQTPQSLTLAFSVGVYVAFSPFPGAHTLMMLFARWAWGLNFPIMFIVASINNPWTMIPFYSFDYAFGYWFFHSFLGVKAGYYISLGRLFGGHVCLWSFLIGGNLLGTVFAILLYPFASRFFHSIAVHKGSQ